MGLFSGLFIGREALSTNGAALATIADNLANSNTTAFKTQRTEFSDLLADSIGSLFSSPVAGGNGSQVDEIRVIHTQGVLEGTERALDFAINGEGYFIVKDGESNAYTRAGNFGVNTAGELITADGDQVLGFTEASPETLVPLQLRDIVAAATPTTTVNVLGNLDVSSALTTLPAAGSNFEEIGKASSFNTGITVIDSLGATHDVALRFFHTENLGWTVQAYVDAEETGGEPETPVLLGSGTIAFGPDGTQGEGATTSFTISPAWANGASAQSITIDLSKFTGFSKASTIDSTKSDGISPGNVSSLELADDGTLSARLDNGQLVTIGTMALAKFVNQGGLEKIGDNKFVETTLSGEADNGAPQSEGRGTIRNSSLEASTVDDANEFVNLVRYQRGYQAGSQVISTISQILDRTIQIA